MFKSFLIKYAEIGVKGKNRYLFENALVDNAKRALDKIDGNFKVTKENGRIYAIAEGDYDFDEAVDKTIEVRRQHAPNTENRAVYDADYKTYLELYQQLKGIMKKRGGNQ